MLHAKQEAHRRERQMREAMGAARWPGGGYRALIPGAEFYPEWCDECRDIHRAVKLGTAVRKEAP